MGSPKRWDRGRDTGPEALAAQLPNELREFEQPTDSGTFLAHVSAVADWLNHAVPGLGHDLAYPVMEAAGLTAERFFRQALKETYE